MNYKSEAGFGPHQNAATGISDVNKMDYHAMLAATPHGGRPTSTPEQVPTQTFPQQTQDQNPYRTLPQTPRQAPQPLVFAAPAPGQTLPRPLPQTPHQAPQPPVFAAPAPGLAPTQAAPQQMPGMVAPDGVQLF